MENFSERISVCKSREQNLKNDEIYVLLLKKKVNRLFGYSDFLLMIFIIEILCRHLVQNDYSCPWRKG